MRRGSGASWSKDSRFPGRKSRSLLATICIRGALRDTGIARLWAERATGIPIRGQVPCLTVHSHALLKRFEACLRNPNAKLGRLQCSLLSQSLRLANETDDYHEHHAALVDLSEGVIAVQASNGVSAEVSVMRMKHRSSRLIRRHGGDGDDLNVSDVHFGITRPR